MKKIFSLITLLVLFTAAACFAQPRTTIDLMGIWAGNQLRVEFMDNSKVALVFTGNKKQVGTYTGDFLLTPSTLEMSFNDGDKKLEFKCLIQFIDNNTLKWESFSKTDHPYHFTRAFSMLSRVKN